MTYHVMYGAAALATFILTVVISHYLIPVLASHKMGQRILEIGPRWHKSKEGTPTMGGVAFIISSLICGIAFCVFITYKEGWRAAAPLIMTLAMATASGLIGMIDDRAKLKKKQNEGLTAPQKLLLQLIVSAIYLLGMFLYGGLTTVLHIPFFNVNIDFGVFYYAVALLLLCGMMNSVNLTDGIDGLASSVTLVVALFFGAAAFFAKDSTDPCLALVSALMLGSTAGFLVYNFYPARVFMGDTGSLFLGGLVVGAAFLMNNPLIVVVCGIVYICETASDILQVLYFKISGGKRIFKMAPIHHHFEKCGWSEIKIVTVFSFITALFCVIAWFGL